jgi:hypothetical protein
MGRTRIAAESFAL